MPGIGPAQYVTKKKTVDTLDETQAAEALQILHCIQTIREKQSSTSPAVFVKLYHAMAMLYIVMDDYKSALEYSVKAVNISRKISGKKDDGLPFDLRESIRRLSIKAEG